MTGNNAGWLWHRLRSYHRLARPVVTLCALVAAAAYLCWHAAAMLALAKRLSLLPTLITIATIYLQWYLVALRDKCLLHTFQVREANLRTLAVINAQQLILNVIPLYLGSMLKAQLDRQEWALPYSPFAMLLTMQSSIALAISSFCGAVGAFWLGQHGLLGIFAFLTFGPVLFALCLVWFRPVPIPLPTLNDANGSVESVPRRFAWQIFLASFLLTLGCQLLQCGRLSTLFGAIGLAHSWADVVLYAAVSQLSLWLVVTPAGIGTKELLFGLVATSSGQSASLGVFTAVTERAIAIACSLVMIGSDQMSSKRRHRLPSKAGSGEGHEPT